MVTKVLITGIGNIGKSTLREKACNRFPHVVGVDMDYATELPAVPCGGVLLVESVHGLEEGPEHFDLIVYLLPPFGHSWRWLKRGWAWWRLGIIELSDPKGIKKPFAAMNIPIIWSFLFENILNRKKWVREDLNILKRKRLVDKTWIGYPDDVFKFLVGRLSR
ncbi:MAG: hypothetical protein ACLQSX_03695 [Smithella sp.]